MRWALLAFCGPLAYACSCGGKVSPVQAWADSPLVFVGSVEHAHPVYRPGDIQVPEQIVEVKVEEPFKGVSRSAIVRLQQPGGCAPSFQPGQQLLIYARALPGDKNNWYVPGCGRSSLLADAADDLLFLRGLPRSAEANRLSGEVSLAEASPVYGESRRKPRPGVAVTVLGGDRSWRLTTNADGIFEIYGLPPGRYRIAPDIPPGMTLSSFFITGPPERRQGEISFDLGERSGVSVRLVLTVETWISGRVLDPQGKPLSDVDLALEPVKGETGELPISAYSKEDGSYRMADMTSGTYRIVANRSGAVTANRPFPTIYYPGVSDRQRATVVTIVAGDQRTGFDLRIPELAPRSILAGRLQFSEGSPVPGAYVRFSNSSGSEARARTGPEGGFELRVLQGGVGEIAAELIVAPPFLAQCPQWKDGLSKDIWIKANPISVAVYSDQRSLLLTLPVPPCEAWVKQRP